MRRFKRLWSAIVQWWKDEDEDEDPPELDRTMMDSARKLLVEYDDLYGRRTTIANHLYRDQAATIVHTENIRRPPSLENEVRVLACAVNQLLRHLEEEDERTNILRRHR